jgi:hypothetical protein
LKNLGRAFTVEALHEAVSGFAVEGGHPIRAKVGGRVLPNSIPLRVRCEINSLAKRAGVEVRADELVVEALRYDFGKSDARRL